VRTAINLNSDFRYRMRQKQTLPPQDLYALITFHLAKGFHPSTPPRTFLIVIAFACEFVN
jgi:hypothetical protein